MLQSLNKTNSDLIYYLINKTEKRNTFVMVMTVFLKTNKLGS